MFSRFMLSIGLAVVVVTSVSAAEPLINDLNKYASDDITYKEVSSGGKDNVFSVNTADGVKYYEYTLSDTNPLTTKQKISTSNTNFVGNVVGVINQSTTNEGNGGALHVSANLTNISVDGAFIGNVAASVGGAISNQSKTVISSLKGDYINNTVCPECTISAGGFGGAVNNAGTIQYIKANFIGNRSATGGALRTGTYGNIEANFINNYAGLLGGAIFNFVSIDSVTGNFIGNTSPSGGAIYSEQGRIGNINAYFYGNGGNFASGVIDGGAIANSYNSTIGNITGTFEANSVSVQSGGSATGGAISNSGVIQEITAQFKNNQASGVSQSGYMTAGGAIFNNTLTNTNGVVGSITIKDSLFDGNSANSSVSQGGAIYNNAVLNVSDTVFTNNTAAYGGALYVSNTRGTGSTILKNVEIKNNIASLHGGAIYSTANVTLSADGSGKKTVIQGNKLSNGANEAIYMDGTDSTLTLSATNGGSVEIYDIINGVSGYNISITGDQNSSVSLNNYIVNADVIAEKVNINLLNGAIKKYTLNTLNSYDTARWNVDINLSDLNNVLVDQIETKSASSGKVVIGDLNILDGSFANISKDQTINPFKVQILLTQSDALQLAFSEELAAELSSYDDFILNSVGGSVTNAEIKENTNWNDEYMATVVTGTITYGKLGLTTTTTTNDSIGIVESHTVDSTTTQESMGDTLVLVAASDQEVRNFNASKSTDKYDLSADIGSVAGGTLNINGVSDAEGKVSELNMNSHKGFNLTEDTVLSFNNITVGGADGALVNVSNEEAQVNLTNVNLNSDITGSVNYGVNISGKTNITKAIDNATVTATNATLSFAADTFETSSLTITGSEVDFTDGATTNYNIGSLTSDDTTDWSIDIDATEGKSDTISSNNSSGTVYINKINFIGSSDENIVIQVLKNTDNNSNLQLALNEDNFNIVEDASKIDNTVYYSKNYITQDDGIALDTTDTTNDSIKIYKGAIYDALVLINDKKTTEDRFYIFDMAGTHTLGENLQATTAGSLTIEGYQSAQNSVIDANQNSLFNLANETTLNLSNVTLTNASGNAITVSDKAELNLTNVLFNNNGGNAISASGNVNLNVKDTDLEMSENIEMNGADLTLNAQNGTLNLNNSISGQDYNLILSDGNVNVHNKISGVKDMEMSSTAVLGLGLEANIEVENMKHMNSTSTLNIATAGLPILQVDVDIANNKMSNGLVKVNGDISGTYGVIVNALSEQYSSETSAFLEALNDDNSTASEFSVLRVMGNPYMWKTVLNAEGETQGSTWYLAMSRKDNDQTIQVTPEVLSGVGLHDAAIEQTRSVVRNVSNKVASARAFCPNCGIVADTWNGEKLYNAWVVAQGEDVNIEKPVDMDGKIWGVEAGFDLQNDINNALGVFVSYRDGEYDLSGRGSKYVSDIGAKINIDSYLAGLYYRYDKNDNWLFASVYGGMQDANIDTDDNVVNIETDGVEFGASAEIGHSFVLNKKTTLSPSLAVKYTQINFDDASDNVDKNYNWGDIKQFEAELAMSLERKIENGKVYVRPSVIQTITRDDNVSISRLKEIATYKDGTLGRIEIGGNYNFNNSLSGYGWINYTCGSNYNATALGVGLNYNW